jgi:NADH:ubiquinone oxidoreductase subunit 4 (subunit M)
MWVQRAFYGPVLREPVNQIADLGPRESALALAMTVAIFTLGVFPSVVLEPAQASVAQLVERLDVAADSIAARL